MTTGALLKAALLPAFLLAGMGSAHAQQPTTETEARQAARSAKDLAAFQAFRSLVSSQSYGLSDEELSRMIEWYLRDHGGPPPHQLPLPGELRGRMDRDYQRVYDAMLRKATQGLDPQGEWGLEGRLREYLERHPGVREQSQKRYEAYLSNADTGLPAALDRVGKRMVADQAKRLRQVVIGYVRSGKLDVERLEAALESDGETDLVNAVHQEVMESCDASLRPVLLIDAHAELQADVERVVADGIGQLRERLQALQPEPTARTLEGITRELQRRLQAVRERQAREAQNDSLRGRYGDSPLVAARLGDAVDKHFDRVVATIVRQLGDGWRHSDTTILPPEHRKLLDGEIRGDVAAHWKTDVSRQLLGERVEGTFLADFRPWLLVPVAAFVKESQSELDRDYSEADLHQHVESLVRTPDSDTSDSWLKAQQVLREQYARLITEVRNAIALTQAQHDAPALAAGTWRPTEQEILALRKVPQLQHQHLAGLGVWQGRVPDQRAALQETWLMWLNGAQSGMEIGRSALRAQESIVDELLSTVANTIAERPGEDEAYWVREYTDRVQAAWGQSGNAARESYPYLFSATTDKIRANLLLLLLPPQNADHSSDVESAAVRAQKARDRQGDPDAMPVHPEGAEEGTVAAPASGADGVGSAADHRPHGVDSRQEVDSPEKPTPLPEPPRTEEADEPSEMESSLAPRDRALAAQNEMVDRLERELARQIESARRQGERFDLESWNERCMNRAISLWREDGLSHDFPEFFPSVARRLGELPFLLLTRNPSDLEAWALERQAAIVDEHRARFEAMIRGDPDPVLGKYERLYGDRVRTQWTHDDSPTARMLRAHCPDLLPATDIRILRTVFELLFDRGGDIHRGDGPDALPFTAYRIGFWGLLVLVALMAVCWYWNIRSMRASIAAKRRFEGRRTIPSLADPRID